MVLTMKRWPLLLLFLMLLSGCHESADSDAQTRAGPDILVRLSDAEIRGLDPQKYSDLTSMRVARDQFDGLTQYNGAGETVAALAASWTISEDQRIWRFLLKPDARFSDDKPITAQIFAQVWQRLNDPGTASPHLPLFRSIDSITAEDARTVRITLANPNPDLPYLLAHPAMAALPMHEIAARGDRWTAMRPMVTSGPYRLTRWRLNDMAVLKANPGYHGQPAAISTVQWKPMDDNLSGMRLVLSGAADIAHSYPDNRHQWLRDNHPDYVRNSDYLGTYYYAFNTRRPPFDNADIRRALSLGVNRDFLTSKLIGLGNKPAFGVAPPQLLPASAQPQRPASKHSARRARAMLEAAGYSDAHPLRFEIRINTSREHRRVAVALAAMWAELPVEATILNSEATLHFASLRRGDFDLARSGWIADLPTAENFLSVHRSDAGAVNYSGYDNPRYDAALDSAARSGDRIYHSRAQDILAADMPVLPLYHYTAQSLVSPRVRGWQDNDLNIHPSAALSLDEKR